MSQVKNLDSFYEFDKSWSFGSPQGGGRTFYIGGFYDFASTHNNFSSAATHGTANASYAAHFFVVLGATAVDEIVLTVTGTSITDGGARTTSDTEIITIPNGTGADTYYETAIKWIGQVSTIVTSGTAKDCNYGFVKYWDNNNQNFKLLGLEVTWLGGANDATPNILLRHHKSTGWTFNSGTTPTPPTALVSMNSDHATEIQVKTDEEGAWKRDNLTTEIDGGDSQGTIFEIVTGGAKTFEHGTAVIRITTR